MIIKLVRHALSKQNTGEINASQIGDHTVPLADTGYAESKRAGEEIGLDFLCNCLPYCSPYIRTRQTIQGIFDGADVAKRRPGVPRIYEDARLREMEWGWDKSEQDKEKDEDNRDKFGYFYYRMPGGESAADCYDRVSGFIDSMHRQAERKRKSKILIVTHGITIRVFVMRWFHLTPEQYDNFHNPHNCAIITIAPNFAHYIEPQLTSGRWGVNGLRFRKESP